MKKVPRIHKSIREISELGEWEIPRSELAIQGTLGRGSFGLVKMATWRGTPVAAKILDEESAVNAEFRCELDTLTRLHHPNIVQLLGACTLSNPYIIVMELMPSTLEAHIPTLKSSERRSVSLDIARGLAYIHNRTPDFIIHRDLKPSNILLTASKKAKLADFGISMLHKDKSDVYNMTGETGSYRYMAPEVLRHEKYNYKVDIWSFGMVLLHVYTCESPYQDVVFQDMIREIANYKLPKFNLRKVDPEIQLVLTSCWNTPNSRPEALDLVSLIQCLPTLPERTKCGCV